MVIGEECFSVQLSWNVSQTNRTGKVVIEKFMLDYSLTNSNATSAVETITLGGGVYTYVFPPGSLKQNTNYSFTLRAGAKYGDNNVDSVVDIGHSVVTVLTPLCSGEVHTTPPCQGCVSYWGIFVYLTNYNAWHYEHLSPCILGF